MCIDIHRAGCTCVSILVLASIHACAHVYACMDACACMRTHALKHVHTGAQAGMQARTHARTQAHTHHLEASIVQKVFRGIYRYFRIGIFSTAMKGATPLSDYTASYRPSPTATAVARLWMHRSNRPPWRVLSNGALAHARGVPIPVPRRTRAREKEKKSRKEREKEAKMAKEVTDLRPLSGR